MRGKYAEQCGAICLCFCFGSDRKRKPQLLSLQHGCQGLQHFDLVRPVGQLLQHAQRVAHKPPAGRCIHLHGQLRQKPCPRRTIPGRERDLLDGIQDMWRRTEIELLGKRSQQVKGEIRAFQAAGDRQDTRQDAAGQTWSHYPKYLGALGTIGDGQDIRYGLLQ